MNDAVRVHYSPAGLTERLKAVLGPQTQPLTPQQLGGDGTFDVVLLQHVWKAGSAY